MSGTDETLKRIRSIVTGRGSRVEKARQVADVVRSLGNYPWVGVYDVGKEMVSILAYSSASSGASSGAYSGPGAPVYPSFPVSKGLTGAAIREKATVVVADVRTDPRYLTAFGNTLSEIIVPIFDPERGEVIGTIDVESERANAFSPHDRLQLPAAATVTGKGARLRYLHRQACLGQAG